MKIILLLTVIYLMKISNAIWPFDCGENENDLNYVHNRIDYVDGRLDAFSHRLDTYTDGMAGLGNQLANYGERLDHFNNNWVDYFQHRLDGHKDRLDGHMERLDGHSDFLFEINTKANNLRTEVDEFRNRIYQTDDFVNTLVNRIEALETTAAAAVVGGQH
jgi:archaellum component FlaC